jgi:TonB family protein
MRTLFGALTLVSIGFSPPLAAQGEWRCDCTTIVDTCMAQVQVQPSFVTVTTDRAQCSRVDYFIDGLPFVTVVAEGSAREDWIAGSNAPRVLVQSCQVCRDNATAAASAPVLPRDTSAPSGPLTPIVATEPVYPEAARNRAIEGSVTVQFQVNSYGGVDSPRVTAANPPGVFDMAALSAVSRWRYPADPERAPTTLTETIPFTLDAEIWRAAPAGTTETTGTSPAVVTPANQCVKESVSYNYGELIEVGLINACGRPLAVATCAVGTGAQADRWSCSDATARGTLLVPPADGRVGARASAVGGPAATYADTLYVARAPNTEYWWIACDAQDERCRSEARRWAAALDGRTSSMNPAERTRLAVGRSY